jgi:hypothetical protein
MVDGGMKNDGSTTSAPIRALGALGGLGGGGSGHGRGNDPWARLARGHLPGLELWLRAWLPGLRVGTGLRFGRWRWGQNEKLFVKAHTAGA